jgi:hypothetical protein
MTDAKPKVIFGGLSAEDARRLSEPGSKGCYAKLSEKKYYFQLSFNIFMKIYAIIAVVRQLVYRR